MELPPMNSHQAYQTPTYSPHDFSPLPPTIASNSPATSYGGYTPVKAYEAPGSRGYTVNGYNKLHQPDETREIVNTKKAAINKLKGYVRALRLFSKTISAILNSVMFAIMALTIITFLSTRHEIRAGRNIWPRDPKTWPTIMLLVGSAATLFLSIGQLIAYCTCYARMTKSWKLALVANATHLLIWVVVTFLYKYEKNLDQKSNDLWGWSCSSIADSLQNDSHSSVKFDKFCNLQVRLPLVLSQSRAVLTVFQTVSWYLSIAETGLKLIFVVAYVSLTFKRRKEEKKVKLVDGFGDAGLDLLQDFT
jgi:hypothetical protein